MNLWRLMPRLMLVAFVPPTAIAQTTTYTGVAVESRATSTTYTGEGLSIVGQWPASNPLYPFVPETRVNASGNLAHWNSEGYSGRTEWPRLGAPSTGWMLVGRTLQGSPAGEGKAVFAITTNAQVVRVGELEPGGWVDRYTCDLTIRITDWPWHPGDFNRSGNRSIMDIYTFCDQYMLGRPQADFDGDDAVTPQDLFDFIAAYLS